MARFFVYLLALVSVTLLTVGCTFHTHSKPNTPKKNVEHTTFTLFIDSEYSGPERELIVDGFKVWETATHGVVRFEIATYPFDSSVDDVPEGKDGECTFDTYVVRMPDNSKIVKKLDGRSRGNTLGFTMSNCQTRVVALITSRLRDANLFKKVVVHEAGHLVGLDHIPVPQESIMFPSTDKSARCPTALDMKQLCMLYECDWRATAYCD